MKNPLWSQNIFCFEYRVYGIQNDRLELRINEFFSVLQNSHRSQRYEQKTEMKKILNRKYLLNVCPQGSE